MSDSKKIFLGIDEAGRGSVIGPLVIGAVSVDVSTLEYYTGTEIADSKQLSPQKRLELYNTIKETSFSYSTVVLEPFEIDKAVKSSTSNLNLLELQAMSQLIRNNPESTDIIIDAISKPDYCTTNLKTFLKQDSSFVSLKKINTETLRYSREINTTKKYVTILAQNKADVNFKVVSAASIIAKVTRDKAIKELEEQFSLEKGILASGYPNEHLQLFLQKYKTQIKKHEFPFIRYSWEWGPLKSIISPEKLKQTKIQF